MIYKLYVLKFMAFFAGCYACYFFQVAGGQSAVVSAALVGFICSFLHFPKLYEKKGLHAAIFSGGLAGMCSRATLESPLHVCLLSLIGAGIYVLARPHADGIGGKLGTIAFLSCAIFFLARGVW